MGRSGLPARSRIRQQLHTRACNRYTLDCVDIAIGYLEKIYCLDINYIYLLGHNILAYLDLYNKECLISSHRFLYSRARYRGPLKEFDSNIGLGYLLQRLTPSRYMVAAVGYYLWRTEDLD